MAIHAIQSSFPGGNAAVSIVPERTARSAFRVEMAMSLSISPVPPIPMISVHESPTGLLLEFNFFAE
jgi:hypothetical protein